MKSTLSLGLLVVSGTIGVLQAAPLVSAGTGTQRTKPADFGLLSMSGGLLIGVGLYRRNRKSAELGQETSRISS